MIRKILKDIRLNKSITHQDMAKEIFVTADTIKSWEKGIIIPTIDELRLVSQIYDVTYDYLLVCALETPRKAKAHKLKSLFKYGYYILLALISSFFITLGAYINPLIVFYLYPLLDQTPLIHFTNKYFDILNNRYMVLIQNLLAYPICVSYFSVSIHNN